MNRGFLETQLSLFTGLTADDSIFYTQARKSPIPDPLFSSVKWGCKKIHLLCNLLSTSREKTPVGMPWDSSVSRTLGVAAPVCSAEALAWRAAIGVRVTDVSVQRA